MTTSLPLRAPQTAALISWLAEQTDTPVGYGQAPPGTGWQGPPGASEFQGYGVVHPIPGGQLDGDLARPSVDGDLIWQVNGIGATQAHADAISDLFAAVLLGPLPALQISDDRALMWVRSDIPHAAARQDPDQPAIWWSYARYRLGTTPT